MRRVRLHEPKARVKLEEPKPRKRIRLADPTVNDDGDPPSLDLIARRVIMASLAYYGLGVSVVPDSVFDGWCQTLAKKWRKLDPVRQWQLGSPEGIRASGFHVKVTWAAVGGVISWMEHLGMYEKPLFSTKQWKRSKRQGVSYLYPEDFNW